MKDKEDFVQLHIRVPVSVNERLKKNAAKHKMNKNTYVSYIIRNDCYGEASRLDILFENVQQLKKVIDLIFLTTDTHARFFQNFLLQYFARMKEFDSETEQSEALHRGAEKLRKFHATYLKNTEGNDSTFLSDIYGHLVDKDADYLKYRATTLVDESRSKKMSNIMDLDGDIEPGKTGK